MKDNEKEWVARGEGDTQADTMPSSSCVLPAQFKVSQQSAQSNGTMGTGALGFLSESCILPHPNMPHLSKGPHLPPNCSPQSPRTHLWILSLLFHQHVQLILSPKFVSDAFTSMSIVTTSVSTTITYFLDVYHTLLTGIPLFTLSSFSLPLALIYSLLSFPEWPLQNIKQTMSLCLKLYANFLRYFK